MLLQWGRALVSAEAVACFSRGSPVGRLQWGRALVSAEATF